MNSELDPEPPITALNRLYNGQVLLIAYESMSLLKSIDVHNRIRSRPLTNSKFREWECWIEWQDIEYMKQAPVS